MLNRLQRLLPEGLLADAAWLTRMGYPSSLRSRYVGSGWLQPVTRGVFRRPHHRLGLEDAETPLRWQHVVVSLQMVLERPVAVGGRTALALGGFGHYASSAGPGEIHLYGDEARPGWLGKLPIETPFVFHNAQKLFREEPISDGLDSLKAVLAGELPSGSAPIHGRLIWRIVNVGPALNADAIAAVGWMLSGSWFRPAGPRPGRRELKMVERVVQLDKPNANPRLRTASRKPPAS